MGCHVFSCQSLLLSTTVLNDTSKVLRQKFNSHTHQIEVLLCKIVVGSHKLLLLH